MKNRKIFMGLVVAAMLTAAGGCSVSEIVTGESKVQNSSAATEEKPKESEYSNSRFKAKEIDKHTLVLIDKQTNVQYLRVVRNAGFDGGLDIIPLYQANGKPYVGDEVKDNRFSIQKVGKHTHIITDGETKVQYLKLVRNEGYDGGVVLEPLLNPEGGLLLAQ